MTEQTFEKINFLEKYPEHYLSSHDEITTTKTMSFYTISTHTSEPFTQKHFAELSQVLQWLAFMMKFSYKRNPPENFYDFDIPPIEMSEHDDGSWTVALPQPQYVTAEKVLLSRRTAQAKAKWEKLPQVSFDQQQVKQVIQIRHTGAYEWLEAVHKKLLTYANDNKISLVDPSSPTYIYLNDLRRTKPDALETIVRLEIT